MGLGMAIASLAGGFLAASLYYAEMREILCRLVEFS
jgi:hypothetical protein